MRHFLFLALILSLGACSLSGSKMPSRSEQVQKSVLIGENLEVSQYSNIYFAPQPSEKDWVKLKSQGFIHIINLRASDEYDEKKERSQVESLKLNYTQVPIKSDEKLTKGTVNLVTQAVMAHRKKGKTLIHCSSGQRAAFWAGAHFYQDHNQSAEEGLQTARDLGLSQPKLTNNLNSFFNENKR